VQIPSISFIDWLRNYFQENQYQSISTDDFLVQFKGAFPKVSATVNWDTWLYGVGYCPTLAPLDMTLVNEAIALSDTWIGLFEKVEPLGYDEAVEECRNTLGSKIEEFNEWDAKQQHGFLTDLRGRIAAGEDITWHEKCAGYLHDIHGFNTVQNAEIRFMWCRLAISACWEKVLPNVEDFLAIQGRMKYIRPLYTDLDQTYPKGDYAKEQFALNRNSYHSIAVKMIEQDLGLSSRKA